MMKLSLVLIISVFSAEAFARSISDSEMLYRCYGHLTSKRLKSNHPLLLKVKNAEMSAEAACEAVLESAVIGGDGLLVETSRDAKAVLSNMTKLHMTFFKNQQMEDATSTQTLVSNDVYDEQGSALHYTKVLFDSSHGIDDILSAKKDIEGVRSDPFYITRGPSSNYLSSNFTRRSSGNTKVAITPNFVMTGALLGLQDARAFNVPESTGSEVHGTDVRSTIGGGILGTRSYLKRSTSTTNVNFDGALKMNRAWANIVLEDFLCKSLPAVRLADGQPYKNRDATAAFRKTDGCIQCHATMDQLAAGGRAIRRANITRDNGSSSNPQFSYYYNRAADRDAASHWPVLEDSSYYRRPASGRLYYRSYTGDLFNKAFNNLDELATRISETDDFYSCVAKKYYKHFTGVNASLADINDPFATVVLNEEDSFHRNQVVKLGQALKKNKDTMLLIKSIMKSDVYRQKGYTILEAK